MVDKTKNLDAVLVIGLGRFGTATAKQLMKQGREVLAIEQSMDKVESMSKDFTYIVQADATNMAALGQLDAEDFKCAVVGVGTSIEASVLITANLVDLGIPNIWVKAITSAHGKILERIGAHHVVYPEADAGVQIAHLLSGKLLDFIEFKDGYSIAKMRPPREVIGQTLLDSKIRSKYNLTVIATKKPGEDLKIATYDTLIEGNSIMIVFGTVEEIEFFANES
ncbi:MAG: TrkA family potassium uptake protein [Micrococcaceae bacterium]